MFALFFSLYYSMFMGRWYMYSMTNIKDSMIGTLNKLGQVLTSIFNGVTSPVSDLGTTLTTSVQINSTQYTEPYISLCAFVLALITSIGIVVMAVKGVKKAFGIFFMGIRNI